MLLLKAVLTMPQLLIIPFIMLRCFCSLIVFVHASTFFFSSYSRNPRCNVSPDSFLTSFPLGKEAKRRG